MAVRILIVEDNTLNQKVIQLMLKKAGYSFDAVWNGREAVDACRTRHYDLVLMDCQMPEMDGLEATKHIRSLSMQQPIIIAVTAHSLARNREECLASGMDDYLSKPYQQYQLLSLIQSRLDRP